MTFPQKRSRFWTFLSLWSLLALAAPQLLWACPAMGPMPSTPHSNCCCQKNQKSDSSSTSRTQTENASKKCCHKVPLPASDTSGENGKVALSANRNLAASIEYFLLPSTPAIAPTLDYFAPQPFAAAFSTAKRALVAQNRLSRQRKAKRKRRDDNGAWLAPASCKSIDVRYRSTPMPDWRKFSRKSEIVRWIFAAVLKRKTKSFKGQT